MQAEGLVEKVPFEGKCKECGDTFRTPATLLAHEPCFLSSPSYHRSASGTTAFTCPLGCQDASNPCSLPFADIKSLESHLDFVLEKMYRCTSCQQRFASKSLAFQHVQSAHQESLGHVCEECLVSYADSDSLEAHQLETGHSSGCVVESVSFFENEASPEGAGSLEAEEEETADSEKEEEDDSSAYADDDRNDPDFVPAKIPTTQRAFQPVSSALATVSSDNIPSWSQRNPLPPEMPRVKRGPGRPRKNAYPNIGNRVPVVLSIDNGLRQPPPVKRGPGRPRKNPSLAASAPTRVEQSRRPGRYKRRRFVPPRATAAITHTPPAPAANKQIIPCDPTAQSTEPPAASLAVLASIKHCASCNAMFFQQADFDRHFTAHLPAPADGSVHRHAEDEMEATVQAEPVIKLPGSNSEPQDSSDSFADAMAGMPGEIMDLDDGNMDENFSEID